MGQQLRVYKFLVVPVLQQVDDDGVVVAELQPPNPDSVFGIDGLTRYAAGFEAKLAEQLASHNGQPTLEQIAQVEKEVRA